MFAVIKTGGKQYKVSKGDKLRVEKLEKKEGSTVNFSEVLMVSENDGTGMKVGNPKVSGAKVEAKILEQGRAKKIVVTKYKAKTRYKKTQGHRQPFTKIEITKIAV